MRIIARTVGSIFAAVAIATAVAPAAGAATLSGAPISTQAPADVKFNTTANFLPGHHGHYWENYDICWSEDYGYYFYCNDWGYDHEGWGHWGWDEDRYRDHFNHHYRSFGHGRDGDHGHGGEHRDGDHRDGGHRGGIRPL